MRLRKLVLIALATSTFVLTVGTVQAGRGKKKRGYSPMTNTAADVMPMMQTGTTPATTAAPTPSAANPIYSTPSIPASQMTPAMQTGQMNSTPFYNTNSRRGNRGRRGMSNDRQPMQPMQPGSIAPTTAGVQPSTGAMPIADGSIGVRPEANVAPTTGVDAQTRTANYLSAADPRSVRLKITMPTADARLFIQGQPMTPTGVERNFISPPLETGRQYISTVRAVWKQAGTERVFERQVNVTPGQETTLRIE